MIAFIDLEANTDSDNDSERTDRSIIEVGIVVKKDFCSNDIAATYSTFVKPAKNEGKVRERITELTGITQEDVDSGITIDELYKQIRLFVEKNNITRIHYYGRDDQILMENYEGNTGAQKYFKRILLKLDYLPKFKKMTTMYHRRPSLQIMRFSCNIHDTVRHRAVEDAEYLGYLVEAIYKNRVNEDNVDIANKFIDTDKGYCYLSKLIKKKGIDSKISTMLLGSIKEGTAFITAEEYLRENGCIDKTKDDYAEQSRALLQEYKEAESSYKHLSELLNGTDGTLTDRVINGIREGTSFIKFDEYLSVTGYYDDPCSGYDEKGRVLTN